METGNIDLDKIQGETIEMNVLDGASSDNHSICEWALTTNPNKTLTLVIERSSDIYEDIVIKYVKDDQKISLTNKEITSCDDGEFTLKVTNVTEFKIRAQILDNKSKYSMVLAQEGKDLSYPTVFLNYRKLITYLAVFLVILF